MKLLPVPLLLLLILVFSSCRQYRYIYSASKMNTPMLREKGDTRLNTSFSSGNATGSNDSLKNSGIDVQAAYAIKKHWGVMASYYRRWEQDYFKGITTASLNDSYVRYNRRSWEVATGFFTAEKSAVFGIYGGMAFGKFSALDIGQTNSTNYTRNLSGNLTKYFLQPGFTFGKADKVKFDFSMRFCLLDFGTIRHNYTRLEIDQFNIRRSLEGENLFSRETSVSLSIPVPPTDWMRFETSYSNVTLSQTNSARRWNLSFGLTADLSRMFR